MNSFIQLLKDKILAQDQKARYTSSYDFRGYSPEEIAAVMQHQEVSFIPGIYRQFLTEMGHSFAVLEVAAQGYILKYERLLFIKQHFRTLIAESQVCSKNFLLPKDILVFACSYEDYWFFRTNEENNDPPVYFYHECFSDALQVTPYLSDWLLTQAFYHPRLWVEDHLSFEAMKLWNHE